MVMDNHNADTPGGGNIEIRLADTTSKQNTSRFSGIVHDSTHSLTNRSDDKLDLTPISNLNSSSSPIRTLKKATQICKVSAWHSAFICMCYRFLCDGVEYAIVIPTLYDYLKESFQQDERYTGIVLSCYAIGGLISAPIMGYLSDRLGSGKNMIIIGCFLSVAGNLMYFAAPTKEYVAFGRFLAGIGIDPIVLSEIGRVEHLDQEAKSRHISQIYTCRQFGVLLGPVFVIVITYVIKEPFTWYGVLFSKHNFGGFCCAILYLASAVSFVLLYRNKQHLNDDSTDEPPEQDNLVINADQPTHVAPKSDKLQKTDDCQTRLVEPDSIAPPKLNTLKSEEKATFTQVLFYEHVVIAVFGCYTVYYQQSMIEALLVPLTSKMFNWTQIEVAVLFLATSVEAIFAYISTIYAGKILKGVRGNLAFGVICSAVTVSGMFVYSIYAKPGLDWTLPCFLIAVAIYVFFMPYVLTATASLVSVGVPKHLQASFQSVRTSASNISMILGPCFTTHIYQLLNLPSNSIFGVREWGFRAVWFVPIIHCIMLCYFMYFSWDNLSAEKLDKFAALPRRVKKGSTKQYDKSDISGADLRTELVMS